MKEAWIGALRSSLTFLERSIECLETEDGDFQPKPELMTTTQMLGHIAFSVEWFVDGAFSPKGFDVDVETHLEWALRAKSLEDAKAWIRRAYEYAIAKIESASLEEWQQPLPAGTVMPGMPRHCVIDGIVEHTAHHRGALTVYARLRDRTPRMPYA